TGILAHRPDVVLVDYLMPEMHGADLVREITSNLPDIACVIISQVSDKEMIGASYEAGIEFFIQKPINLIEVKRVLTSVIEKIEMKRALNQINGLLQKTTAGLESRISGKQAGHMDRRHNMKKVLSRLGILGEKGAVDVLECACLLLENGIEYGVSDHMNTICEELGQ
ncbi:DNA-binding domain-containing protein, partial [Aduncisulcus paluster]